MPKPASRLKVARVRAGWPQAVLAAKVGLNRCSLYRIETGTIKPRREIRKKLAEVLKLSERTLFGNGK